MAIIGFKRKVQIIDYHKLYFDSRISFLFKGDYLYFNIPTSSRKGKVTRENAAKLANWILAVLDKE